MGIGTSCRRGLDGLCVGLCCHTDIPTPVWGLGGWVAPLPRGEGHQCTLFPSFSDVRHEHRAGRLELWGGFSTLSGASDLVFIEDLVCLVFSIYSVILSGLVSAFKAHRGHPHGAVHITCMLIVPDGSQLVHHAWYMLHANYTYAYYSTGTMLQHAW